MGKSQPKDSATERATLLVALMRTTMPVEEKIELLTAYLQLAHQEGVVASLEDVSKSIASLREIGDEE